MENWLGLATYRFLWPANYLLMRFFLRLIVSGRDHLQGPFSGPVILAANHVSYVDPLLISAALPFGSRLFPIAFMVREQVFRYAFGLLGVLLTMLGCFAVQHAGDRRTSRLQDLRRAEQLLGKRTLGIFPEGGRQLDGRLAEFKRGLGRLVLLADGVTVIPIAVHGVLGITVRSFLLRQHQARVVIGPPIRFQSNDNGATLRHRSQLAVDLIRDHIQALL